MHFRPSDLHRVPPGRSVTRILIVIISVLLVVLGVVWASKTSTVAPARLTDGQGGMEPQVPVIVMPPGVPLSPRGQVVPLRVSQALPPSVFAEGRKAKAIDKVVPVKTTVFDLVGRSFELPIPDIRVTADVEVPKKVEDGDKQATAPSTVTRTDVGSLLRVTVDETDSIRWATPKTDAFFNEAGIGGLILLLGYGFVLLRNDMDRYFYDPDRGKLIAGIAISAMFALRLSFADASNGDVVASLFLAAIFTLWGQMRTKFRWSLVALAVDAGIRAMNVEIVAPAEPLRSLYGVLGIYIWDFVALIGVAVAVSLYLLLTRRSRTVSQVHVSTAAAVQDVRIIEDRTIR